MKTHTAADPFAIMMDPATALRAVERSERLQRLQRRVCRPLDKPLIPRVVADAQAWDQAIDDEPMDEFGDE
jgi:hypothetical protein